MLKNRVFVALAAVVLSASVALGEWKEPADGNLTDKQVEGFVGVLKDLKAASESGQGQGLMGAMMAAATGGDAFTSTVTKHGLTTEEFGWVSGKVIEAWSAAMIEDASVSMASSMQTAAADAEKGVAEAQTKLTEARDAAKAAADDAAKVEAALNVEEAEANVEYAQASLSLVKAQDKVMQVQAKRMKSESSDANVVIVRKYLKQIGEATGEEAGEAGDTDQAPAETEQ